MIIYVTGSRGLVGSRFLELVPKDWIILSPEIDELDILDVKALKAFYNREHPDVVINFAAYTDVSRAEEERGNRSGMCWKINVDGVKNIASVINPKKTHFIQISTDMVFPGNENFPGPYSEDQISPTNPDVLTWYGYTKGEAERVVKEILDDKATILRLIYPVRAKFDGKLDYLRKALDQFDQGKLYPMFNDQQVSIALIDEIAMALVKIVDSNRFGIFHASSRDTSTPYELVSYMLEKTREVKDVVKSQTLEEFIRNTSSSPVRYPKFGGLKVETTEKVLGIKYKTWREIIEELVNQGLGN